VQCENDQNALPHADKIACKFGTQIGNLKI
jgi:hypothetical protein